MGAGETSQRAGAPGADMRYLRVGSGLPIVLLHPLRMQLEYFRPLLTHLDTTRNEIVAIELPGHGESAAPRADYTADYFTDAVARVLDECDLHEAVVVGESIGGAIGLGLAARGHPRVARVVALNPYDYGLRGGIRRSSPLANVLFTAMLWPAAGPIVARAGTKGILRRVLNGGLYDPGNLDDELLDALYRCGSLPGHARAFRSLTLNWRTWIDARARYRAIEVPVTLAYADHDWSLPVEREANIRTIPGARPVSLAQSGHFSCLDVPATVAGVIVEAPG